MVFVSAALKGLSNTSGVGFSRRSLDAMYLDVGARATKPG